MIKKWITKISAIDPIDGELKTWFGPYVDAENIESARKWLDSNGMGYCKLTGEIFVEEHPEKFILNFSMN